VVFVAAGLEEVVLERFPVLVPPLDRASQYSAPARFGAYGHLDLGVALHGTEEGDYVMPDIRRQMTMNHMGIPSVSARERPHHIHGRLFNG
jgi:hypothetical protein